MRFDFAWTLTSALIAAVLPASCVVAADRLEFRRDVLPILSDRCFACHGPDGKNRKADLRLDQKSGLMKRVKAGDPSASELIERIESKDAESVMPPAKLKKPLSAKEIE